MDDLVDAEHVGRGLGPVLGERIDCAPDSVRIRALGAAGELGRARIAALENVLER